MKTIVVLLAALLALAASASAQDNYLDQSNYLTAYSGNTTVPGDIDQMAINCAAIMGADNDVDQTNDQNAMGVNIDQMSKNNIVIMGNGSIVDQYNSADAMGLDGFNGSNIEQDQKNLLAVIGDDNEANQSNYATAYNAADPTLGFYIYQTEKNVGVLLGTDNYLNQTNDENATIAKDLLIDPNINQTAKNLAFMVGGDDFVTPTFNNMTLNESLCMVWPQYCLQMPEIIVCECNETDITCMNTQDNACPPGLNCTGNGIGVVTPGEEPCPYCGCMPGMCNCGCTHC